MRVTSFINNSKCIEWGLSMQQGALFDLINQLPCWAEPISIDGEVYYWASKQMICNEIPLAYNKVDTVYRALKTLREKGLINYKKHGEKDCISLTAKGKEWNSEMNPEVGNESEKLGNESEKLGNESEKLGNESEKLGNESEKLGNESEKLGNESEKPRKQIRKTSEIDPTYKNTKINNTKINNNKKINKKDLDLSAFIQQPTEQVWNDYLEHRKNKKAKLTQSALNILVKEINNCVSKGFSVDAVLSECMLRGWQGFRADWLIKSAVQHKQPNQYINQRTSSFSEVDYGETIKPNWMKKG